MTQRQRGKLGRISDTFLKETTAHLAPVPREVDVLISLELQTLEGKTPSTPMTPDPYPAISSLDNFNQICKPGTDVSATQKKE